jgi:DNA-binding SARP family transcriptional activator/tetratricopeptide (TPR) repeat protein
MRVHDKSVEVGATKIRALLGVLAYKANEPVAADTLVYALWDDVPPRDPLKPLQVYVSRLRRVLTESGFAAKVIGEHRTYRLVVDTTFVDYQRFLALVRTGHRAFGKGEHAAAAGAFADAVDLWHGPPIADLKTSWARRVQDAFAALHLLPAQSALFDAQLALGAHDFVLERLQPLLADHPHDDRLAGLWIRALSAADRASEVTAFFRDFSRRVTVDLDTGPSAELVNIYQNSAQRRSMAPKSPEHTVRIPGPPRDTPFFTGRTGLLARLDTLLLRSGGGASVVALDGRPGVGKTTLVRHWARHHRDEFPDGMLHLDLAGYAGTAPLEPGTVLGTFLDELGVPAARLGVGADDRAALLRHTLNGKRVLVVLDNVRDSQHVRPLLAATANCPVVITSRQRLAGIALREGAEHVTVPEFTRGEAIALLDKRIGPRVGAEPEAVDDLVALCDRLPLALRIAGEHVAARPEVSVRDLVDELAQTRRLLDAGSHGDDVTNTLRSAFSWSYRALQPPERHLFRTLGLLPGARFSAEAATAASGLGGAQVYGVLDALLGAHLIEQEHAGRYRTHDLLRLYAADCARDDESAERRDQAVRRMLTWYVESARGACTLLTSDPYAVPPLPEPETVEPVTFASEDTARRWFGFERANLLSLVRLAGQDHDAQTWRLAACLNVMNDHGDLRELLEAQRLGHAAAARAGSPAAAAGCLTAQGVLYGKLDELLRAGRCFEQAYHAFQSAGDEHGEAVSMHNIGCVHLRLGDPVEAITWHRRALTAFATHDVEWAIANVHRWLGDDYLALDQHEEAGHHYARSRLLSEKVGDMHGQGATLNRIAQLALDTGRPELAVRSGQAGLDIHDRTGDRGYAAEVLCTLAAARTELKEHVGAIANATEAARVHDEMRNPAGQAAALEVLGNAHHAAGEGDEARAAWSAAADLHESLNESRAAELRARAQPADDHRVPTPRPADGPAAVETRTREDG